MNILTLSSSIVEPIIAFSIAYTALSAVAMKYFKFLQNFLHHVIIIFIFGLFHGLGFAGAFSALEIDGSNYFSALLAMNIGVEIGQLFVIALAFPVFWMIRNQKGGNIVLHVFAVGISMVALFWGFQRIFY